MHENAVWPASGPQNCITPGSDEGSLGSLEIVSRPRLGTAAYPIDLVVAKYANIKAEDDDNDEESGHTPLSDTEID